MALIESTLEKKSGKKGAWQSRHFQLFTDMIIYSKKPGEKPIGLVPLETVDSVVKDKDSCRFDVLIRGSDTTHSFNLRSATAQLRNQWISTIDDMRQRRRAELELLNDGGAINYDTSGKFWKNVVTMEIIRHRNEVDLSIASKRGLIAQSGLAGSEEQKALLVPPGLDAHRRSGSMVSLNAAPGVHRQSVVSQNQPSQSQTQGGPGHSRNRSGGGHSRGLSLNSSSLALRSYALGEEATANGASASASTSVSAAPSTGASAGSSSAAPSSTSANGESSLTGVTSGLVSRIRKASFSSSSASSIITSTPATSTPTGSGVNTAADASLPEGVVVQGFLKKKSPKGMSMMKVWQKRFFVLYEDVLVYYRKREEEPVGAVSLDLVLSVNVHPKDKTRFDVNIALPDSLRSKNESGTLGVGSKERVMSVRAKDHIDCDIWVTAVRSCVFRQRRLFSPSVDGRNVVKHDRGSSGTISYANAVAAQGSSNGGDGVLRPSEALVALSLSLANANRSRSLILPAGHQDVTNKMTVNMTSVPSSTVVAAPNTTGVMKFSGLIDEEDDPGSSAGDELASPFPETLASAAAAPAVSVAAAKSRFNFPGGGASMRSTGPVPIAAMPLASMGGASMKPPPAKEPHPPSQPPPSAPSASPPSIVTSISKPSGLGIDTSEPPSPASESDSSQAGDSNNHSQPFNATLPHIEEHKHPSQSKISDLQHKYQQQVAQQLPPKPEIIHTVKTVPDDTPPMPVEFTPRVMMSPKSSNLLAKQLANIYASRRAKKQQQPQPVLEAAFTPPAEAVASTASSPPPDSSSELTKTSSSSEQHDKDYQHTRHFMNTLSRGYSRRMTAGERSPGASPCPSPGPTLRNVFTPPLQPQNANGVTGSPPGPVVHSPTHPARPIPPLILGTGGSVRERKPPPLSPSISGALDSFFTAAKAASANSSSSTSSSSVSSATNLSPTSYAQAVARGSPTAGVKSPTAVGSSSGHSRTKSTAARITVAPPPPPNPPPAVSRVRSATSVSVADLLSPSNGAASSLPASSPIAGTVDLLLRSSPGASVITSPVAVNGRNLPSPTVSITVPVSQVAPALRALASGITPMRRSASVIATPPPPPPRNPNAPHPSASAKVAPTLPPKKQKSKKDPAATK